MDSYSKAAVERAMKVQEVMLRAMAKKISGWQAAEILGISDRQMRRWRERYQEFGYDGLFDRRRGKPPPKRVAMDTVEKVLGLYRERYFDGDGDPLMPAAFAPASVTSTVVEQAPVCTGRLGAWGRLGAMDPTMPAAFPPASVTSTVVEQAPVSPSGHGDGDPLMPAAFAPASVHFDRG